MPSAEELKVHQKAYKKFLGETEALRPALYRYCRHLSSSPWDAEDLVQETLLRSYAKLGWIYFEVADLRAYLFRTATNLWLNEQRKAGRVETSDAMNELPERETATPSLSGDMQAALLVLLQCLSPQERIALVLKDVFSEELASIATHLQTSVGTVKSALHRAREKISAAQKTAAKSASVQSLPPQVLQEFVAAFNAHDMERIVALMREDAVAEVVGLVQEYGRTNIRKGSLPHTVTADAFAELAWHDGEPIVILGDRGDKGEKLTGVYTVMRFKVIADQIVEMKYYFFTQDLLKEVVPPLGYEPILNGYFF